MRKRVQGIFTMILTILLLLAMVSMTACGRKTVVFTEVSKERHGNVITEKGISNYKVSYTDAATERILNINISGLESGMIPSDVDGTCEFLYTSDMENIYLLNIRMIAENNVFPFQNASDEEIINAFGFGAGTPDVPIVSRTETEDSYRVYLASDGKQSLGDKMGRQCSLLLHDKKSDALFLIVVNGVGSFADDAKLRKIADSVDVSLAPETFSTEPGNHEFSGERIKGTEIIYDDKKVEYEVFFEDLSINKVIKIKVAGTGFRKEPVEYFHDISWCSFTLGTDADNLYEVRVAGTLPYIVGSLKEVGDDGLASSFAGNIDLSLFSRVETEDDYRLYFPIDIDPSTSKRKYTRQYNLYVERKNDVSYAVMIYANGSFADDKILREIADSVEVSLGETD